MYNDTLQMLMSAQITTSVGRAPVATSSAGSTVFAMTDTPLEQTTDAKVNSVDHYGGEYFYIQPRHVVYTCTGVVYMFVTFRKRKILIGFCVVTHET